MRWCSTAIQARWAKGQNQAENSLTAGGRDALAIAAAAAAIASARP